MAKSGELGGRVSGLSCIDGPGLSSRRLRDVMEKTCVIQLCLC